MLRLVKIRKQLGMSQSLLARRANLHQSTVSATETGRTIPWTGELVAIARTLQWPADDAAALLEEVGDDAD